MDEERQPNGDLDGIAAVPEQMDQLERPLEPAKEEFNLSAPEIPLDHLLRLEVPPISQHLIDDCPRSPLLGFG